MLERLLSEIEPGRVRLILASDPTRLFDEMETLSVESLNHDRPTPQLVGCAWESLPLLSELISDVLDALAETALACWPNWYAESPRQRFGIRSSRGRSPAEFLSVETLRSFRVPVLEPWLRAAIDCCARHQLPRPSGFTDPVQAAQLTLAIDPARFVLLLVATAAEQSSERLDGLARAAEWFARATNVPVAVVVPDSLAGNPALDSISFDALQIEDKSGDRYSLHASEDLCTTDFRSVDVRQTGRPSDGSDEIGGQLTSTSSAAPVKPPDRSRLFVWPLQGVPHPRSEGEQLLARRLRQDDELGPLFEFNQSVRTSRGA
jgi:hypothetical protein